VKTGKQKNQDWCMVQNILKKHFRKVIMILVKALNGNFLQLNSVRNLKLTSQSSEISIIQKGVNLVVKTSIDISY